MKGNGRCSLICNIFIVCQENVLMYYLFHIKQVTVKRHCGMEAAEEGGVPAPSGVMVPSLTANG